MSDRENVGTAFGQSQDNFAYIPIQTYFKMYGNNDTIWLNIQARGAEWMEQTQEEARVMMRAAGGHLAPMKKITLHFPIRPTLMEYGNEVIARSWSAWSS